MQWFRWYSGTATDPKFLLVARLSGQNVAAVVAVWAMLLERASEGAEGKDVPPEAGGRGCISGFDCDAADVVLGLEGGSARAVLDALTTRGLLSGDRITNWDKRQPRREDLSTERVRRFRERQRRERAAAGSAGAGAGPVAWGAPESSGEMFGAASGSMAGAAAGEMFGAASGSMAGAGAGEMFGAAGGKPCFGDVSARAASGDMVEDAFGAAGGAAFFRAGACGEDGGASDPGEGDGGAVRPAVPSGDGNAGKRTETPEERRREDIPLLSSLRSESMPPCGAAARRRKAEGVAVSRRPPSVEEVRAYCEERGNGVSAGHFVDYYAAQGWRLSNGRAMRDWKAAVRNWEHRDAARAPERGGAGSSGRPAAGRVRLSDAEARQRHNDEVCRQVAAELEAQGGF